MGRSGNSRYERMSDINNYSTPVSHKVVEDPAKVMRNTTVLQRLALTQVICLAIASGIDFIFWEQPHCRDQVL